MPKRAYESKYESSISCAPSPSTALPRALRAAAAFPLPAAAATLLVLAWPLAPTPPALPSALAPSARSSSGMDADASIARASRSASFSSRSCASSRAAVPSTAAALLPLPFGAPLPLRVALLGWLARALGPSE
eukprot:356710-Chlamydomonas_euryale.AAC.3